MREGCPKNYVSANISYSLRQPEINKRATPYFIELEQVKNV